MIAVILAAGKGTRFGKITEKTPKSLIPVAGKPILEHILFSLPSQINEVVLVIGHLGEKIKNKFGNKYEGRKITYVNAELNGTGGALWQTRSCLEKEKFLVLNGDDIYWKPELKNLIKHNWSAGLIKTLPPSPKYLTFELDKNNIILGARYPNNQELVKGIIMSTGAFVIDYNIFKYKLVQITKTEYGLPQTVLKAAKKYPIKGVMMKNCLQINCLKDKERAEEILNSRLNLLKN